LTLQHGQQTRKRCICCPECGDKDVGGGTGTEGGYGRADNDLQEHGDGDDPGAEIVLVSRGAFAGENLFVDAFVGRGEFGWFFLRSIFLIGGFGGLWIRDS